MRMLLALGFAWLANVAHAGDFLLDHQGEWVGMGRTESGLTWPLRVDFEADIAHMVSPADGCEAIWTFDQVTENYAKGYENLTVGQDRCYVGLNVVVTARDDGKIGVDWYLKNGMFVSEAVLSRAR